MSLNNHWSYSSEDFDFKTAKNVIRILVECVSKNGNLLMNVGPDARGNIPKESIKILEEVGEWMDKNSASIYGCKKAVLEKPEWGRLTQNGNKLYVHILDNCVGSYVLNEIGDKAKAAKLLCDGSEVSIDGNPWGVKHMNLKNSNPLFITMKNFKLPDEIDTVIEIELKG